MLPQPWWHLVWYLVWYLVCLMYVRLLLSDMFMPTSRVLKLSPGNTVLISLSVPVSVPFSRPLIMLSSFILFSLMVSVFSATWRRSQSVCSRGRFVGQNLVHGCGDAVYERPLLIAGPRKPLAEAHAPLGLGFAETNGV